MSSGGLGTACYVRGAQEIIETMSEMLKIKPGQTTEDGKFTLEATRCIGACGLAPVYTIDHHVFGSANTTSARKELKKYLDD